MLRYVELKAEGHSGPAWIARVRSSKSGRTIYFDGKALKRSGGQGIMGNHYDLASGAEYWVSGVKKDGSDRHRFGSGKVMIEAGVVEEYLRLRGLEQLDTSCMQVIPDRPETFPEQFYELENPKAEA